MTSQLETAIALAQKLSAPEKRQLLNILSDLVNESEPEEDIELSTDEIAASLQRAIHEVEIGQTKPISQLWDILDGE